MSFRYYMDAAHYAALNPPLRIVFCDACSLGVGHRLEREYAELFSHCALTFYCADIIRLCAHLHIKKNKTKRNGAPLLLHSFV